MGAAVMLLVLTPLAVSLTSPVEAPGGAGQPAVQTVSDPVDNTASPVVVVPADPWPTVWGGAGVSVAGGLVAGTGAFLLGSAMVAVDDPATANPKAAREEVVVGGIVLGAGIVVLAAGLTIVGVGLAGP
jgi:hypothetical protein